jgi:hypothetical protein
LPDRIQLFDCESADISVCAIVFDKRIMSVPNIDISDMKFWRPKISSKMAALVKAREKAEDAWASLINKANPIAFCGERTLTSDQEIALTKCS